MGAPGFDSEQVASLRLVSSGGAGVTPAFVESATVALGCRVKRTYGSTEAPTVTTSGQDDPVEKGRLTDGRAAGAVEIRVVETGEIWVRGPEVCEGYLDPEATRLAFTEDGWFRTGDLGVLDADGWLTITGRMKDMIIRGGENISAAEVEAALEAHADVRQAVAVGYPDERLGQRVCAFVVAVAPFGLEACREWMASRGVTRFKWPERVVQVESLPLLAAGKVDRAALERPAATGPPDGAE
jgi:cyclohexanecarboxylate-CoA ligase